MHDPMSLVFEFMGIQIWHNDPCKDGTDDSCGWFKRARHGDKETLKRIISRYDFEWDSIFTSDETKKVYFSGWFKPEGQPVLSPMGITLNMFWLASYEHFNKKRSKANKFCKDNLFDILHFAENNTDSLFQSITCKFGLEKRQDRINSMASCIYGYILRREQKWFNHPRWHVHHWIINIPMLHRIKRRLKGEREDRGSCVSAI